MPPSSSTARTPPPAITPVPGEAGRSSTRAAPNRPSTSCVIVWPCFGTREQVLLRVVDGLRDRERHLARLAVADADAVDLVADHDERGEREPPAALHDLGDAVDLDHALLELSGSRRRRLPSELQSSLACALGERLDASVVQVAAAVEHDGLDPGLLRGRGERLADLAWPASVLSPLNDFGSSTQPAPASVLPGWSSTSCAKTPRFERKTARRGRSAVPATLPRTRRWRRRRASRS